MKKNGTDQKTKKIKRRGDPAKNGKGNQNGQILLIYPLFVMEGTGIQEEIPSMEGQYRYSLDRLPYKLEQLEKAGVSSIMLFGIPDHKDEIGSGAYAQDGIVQKALRSAKERFRKCIM